MKAQAREKNSHIWERDTDDWYVEMPWVSRRLFETETFEGGILDPCCGLGNIVHSAWECGLDAIGSDIEQRAEGMMYGLDFLDGDYPAEICIPQAGGECENIVGNPPFDFCEEFAKKAIAIAARKVAMIFPVRRLAAASKWMGDTPLRKILYLTPRPSMPPGDVYQKLLAEGKKPAGGKQDFCWVIWERGYTGAPETGWLRR